MVRHFTDEEKHKTGRPSNTSDFVKHDCPRKVKQWIKGKEEERAISVKKEFNSIKGNENMVPVNTAAADECPFCGLDITDQAFVPCTDADVEALKK